MINQSVLIVEDDRAYATVLATRCQLMGLDVRIAKNATRAVTMLGEQQPDLLLLDAGIPLKTGAEVGGHGLEICSRLDEIVPERMPVIMLTGRKDSEMITCAKSAGAVYVQKSPEAWNSLRPEIEKALGRNHSSHSEEPSPSDTVCAKTTNQPDVQQEAPSSTPKILCVDDDPDINLAVGMRLRQLGAQPIRAFDSSEALKIALSESLDLVLTDLNMPRGAGNYLIGRLRSNPVTQSIPIVVLTAQRNMGVARDLERIGANAVLFKPLDMTSLLGALRRFVDLPRYSD